MSVAGGRDLDERLGSRPRPCTKIASEIGARSRAGRPRRGDPMSMRIPSPRPPWRSSSRCLPRRNRKESAPSIAARATTTTTRSRRARPRSSTARRSRTPSVTVIQSARPAASAASLGRAAAAAPVAALAEPMIAGRIGRLAHAREQRAPQPRGPAEDRGGQARRRSRRNSTAASPSGTSTRFDLQKYLDRVARMRSAIARKQIEIAELRREIDKLPTR